MYVHRQAAGSDILCYVKMSESQQVSVYDSLIGKRGVLAVVACGGRVVVDTPRGATCHGQVRRVAYSMGTSGIAVSIINVM